MPKPITFTGGKLRALDIARRNPEISDLDFRVLHAIVAALDRDTEQAIRKRETLAREAGGKAVRTVQNSITRLEKKWGLIIVHHGRGRGQANVYELAPQKGNAETPFSSFDTAEKGNVEAPFEVLKKAHAVTLKGERRDQEKGNGRAPLP